MDYQKELIEIQKIRKDAKQRKGRIIKDSEDLKKAVFKIIKDELRKHVQANYNQVFNITIEVAEDNRINYALAKSEDDPDTWYYYGKVSSKEVLEKDILYEICDAINAICKNNITGISAHISAGFESLVISIN